MVMAWGSARFLEILEIYDAGHGLRAWSLEIYDSGNLFRDKDTVACQTIAC